MLTFLSFSHFSKEGRALWKCRCACGRECIRRWGLPKSCGCLPSLRMRQICLTRPSLKHGLSSSRTYKTWTAMHSRCTNPRATGFKYYGALGIKVCKRWRLFENFLSDMGLRPEGLTLDRINSFGNYTPKNCRWATWSQQRLNRRKGIRWEKLKP